MTELKLLPPNPNGPENIPIKGYIKTFEVAVFIIDLKNNDEIIDMRKIDYGKIEDKQWLGKISYWAWSKGYSVETMRLSDAEGR